MQSKCDEHFVMKQVNNNVIRNNVNLDIPLLELSKKLLSNELLEFIENAPICPSTVELQ